MKPAFPFTALVSQDDMKRALLIAAVDPAIGGVLVLGDRGTGKSTAVRALANLLPKIRAVVDCPYNCDPERPCGLCMQTASGKKTKSRQVTVPVVDLPLGATEDRVVGALDLESALVRGEKRFEPGLLARANRGFLYIDEVNLLEDHLVDLLLDVAASGENLVEREGLSVRHPARFVLVGSGNPEEGELRPQLLDRFGLSVTVTTPMDVATRVEVVKRRDAVEADPDAYIRRWNGEQGKLRRRIVKAQKAVATIKTPDAILEKAAELCMKVGTDGLRGELTLMRAARAQAALEGTQKVTLDHLRAIAGFALRHRLRRNPLDDSGSDTRVGRAVDEVM